MMTIGRVQICTRDVWITVKVSKEFLPFSKQTFRERIFSCSSEMKISVMSNSLKPHGLYNSCNSPSQNTGVGSFSLLQGIFPIQGSNPGLPHCRQMLYQVSHQGRSRILEWVAYPFSSGSSQPRNQTRASYIAGRFFTN